MPHSFRPGFLASMPISQTLLRAIREIGELRGKQLLHERQAPQALQALRQAAVIQSTQSSNRLEGILAPLKRLEGLALRKIQPRNRPEQEIAGYQAVLSTVHSNHEDMPFTTGVVLQLHRDLYQYAPQEGGRWKIADNEISETKPDGTRFVRFQPVPAHQTSESMEVLHQRFRDQQAQDQVEPLVLAAAYVLDFLCIHPFLDGNGRMARLLTLLLFYQAGFTVGRYISLEKLVEDNREGYYSTLLASSQGWHEGKHDLRPWVEYFLGVVLLGAYRELESRTGELTMARGAKSDMVVEAIGRLPVSFRYSDIAANCPGVSRPTIRRVLKKMRDQGQIKCVKSGRNAVWNKL
ncbi:MAG: Fic family protein [Acidobacteriota bacterium]|nr:Fic family protein [Acidobacteriota bacterium]